MIIDMHAHCFPDNLAHKALAKLQQTSGLPIFYDGTAAQLVEMSRKAGIDRTVVLPIATKPSQTENINRWALELQNDTLLSFGTIHPEYKKWKAEIKWLKDAGFRGIKMHPEYQGFYVDDQQFYPLYEAIFEAGMMMLFHCGGDLSYEEPFHCPPSRLSKVIDSFPGAKVIAAHMGGYQYWDDVEKYLMGRDLYMDTSFGLCELGAERMIRMIRAHGVDRILFGTDTPWKDQAIELASIRQLDFTEVEMNAILGENAARLLGLT